MKIEENDVFGFDGNNIEQENNDFNYDSISGLGESNYENEDLFLQDNSYELNNVIEDSLNESEKENDEFVSLDESQNEGFDMYNLYNEDDSSDEKEEDSYEFETFTPSNIDLEQEETEEETEENVEDNIDENSTLDESDVSENGEQEFNVEYETIEDETPAEEENMDINMSSTPIEELQNLTHYEEDNIEKTDINSLFDRVSVNVKDASDIFRKNTEMKNIIDKRFNELKQLQSELENSRKKQIDEINKYKDEVYEKLTSKKEEIEKRLNTLKELQASFEKEKTEFEVYKKKEQEKIDKVQKEVQSAYDDRREELSHIEDVLRKQKDSLDEERNQLSLDKIQYESDKNELANNLLKFNELVDSFTNGVDDIKEN